MPSLSSQPPDELNKQLKHIASQPGVVGAIVFSFDGVLMGSSLPEHLDAQSIGIWSMAIYVNTVNISKKLGHNHLHQLVQQTEHGSMLIADFGGALLVTLSNLSEPEYLLPLMRTIMQLSCSNN